MGAGRVGLLVLGGNPVFDVPVDFQFGAQLEKVNWSAHLSLYSDETSVACTWHIPEAHYLEAWGDARADDGTVSIVQPLIAPLYGGRSATEILSAALDPAPQNSADLVKALWSKNAGTVRRILACRAQHGRGGKQRARAGCGHIKDRLDRPAPARAAE